MRETPTTAVYFSKSHALILGGVDLFDPFFGNLGTGFRASDIGTWWSKFIPITMAERDSVVNVQEHPALKSTPKVDFQKPLDLSVLRDRVALVTGGVAGIGLAIVKALAQAGAWVAVCDLNEDAGRRVEAEMIYEGYK